MQAHELSGSYHDSQDQTAQLSICLRYAELGTVYRYERSGVLHGMLRVRGFTQDDSHIFCTPEQLKGEIDGILDLIDTLMTTFGYTYKCYLSTRPEKYLGTDEEWELATSGLEDAMKDRGIDYEIDEGGGVFYAPKIDVKLFDAIGREWQDRRFKSTSICPAVSM
ncbi:MAG: aminoacyl--tRNA ligase-related protein [Cyanobacteriota/Melainabacteria group bacterium]